MVDGKGVGRYSFWTRLVREKDKAEIMEPYLHKRTRHVGFFAPVVELDFKERVSL